MLKFGSNRSCILHVILWFCCPIQYIPVLYFQATYTCIHIPDTSISIPCLSHIDIPFPLFSSKDVLCRGMLFKFCNFDHTGQLQFALA